MATTFTESKLAPGHRIWAGIQSWGGIEGESSEEETYTAASTVSATRPTAPRSVPKLVLNIGDKSKAKASRHQTRTPSPDSRMPSAVPFGRKFGHNSATFDKAFDKASPFKGAAEVTSEDEEASTPRLRKYAATRTHSSVDKPDTPWYEDEEVSTPRVRAHVATRTHSNEVQYIDKPETRLYLDADEEADLSEAEEAAEEVEEVVEGGSKSKKKKKASRPFRATRVRYRKFMNDQYAAIAKDPLNFDLATLDIPPCLVREETSKAKVLLKLNLRAEEARQNALKAIGVFFPEDKIVYQTMSL